jgi:hypothetical protein
MTMHILSGFHVRQILDEVIAVPSGEVGKVFSGIVSLNEIGRFLFEALQTEQTVDSLVAAVLEEYDTDPETARADVTEFLEHLRAAGLLAE